MSLLQELANYQPPTPLAAGDTQAALRKADGTEAGTTDTSIKNDIRFSMMRNILNREGDVNSSDVQDYLERSHEINDEVDTVAFGIETDDDDTIKIYVNADQADQFEAEMSKLLGMDGDAEAAINTLAQTFDIVDVVWPNDPEGDDEETNSDEEINIDDDLGFDSEDDSAGSDQEGEEESSEENKDSEEDVPSGEPEESEDTPEEEFDSEEKPKKDSDSEEDPDSEEDAPDSEDEEGELELDSNGEPIPEMDDEGNPVLDADGNPVMKRKKKAKADDETTGDKEMKTEGLKLTGLMQLAEAKRKAPELTEAIVDFTGASSADMKKIMKQLKDDGHSPEWEDTTRLSSKNAETIKALKAAKKGFKPVKESYQPENGSLGSKFLDRQVVSEAVGEEMEMSDTVLKGLRNRLKKPYEKKTVEMMSLAGVLGRYIDDVDGFGDAIRAGADALRRGGRVQRTFNSFYDALKTLSGTGAEPVAEAKKGSMTLKRLVSVLSQFGLPASAAEENGALATALRRTANKIDKSGEVESSLVDLARALGLSSAEVNESMKATKESWYIEKNDKIVDGPMEEQAAKKKCKELGGDAKGYDTTYVSDYQLKRATMKESQLDEAFPEANDPFIEAAINMMTVLGLPQANLDYRGAQTFQALRKRKMALSNAPALANRINKLAELIKAGERPSAVQEGGSASSTGNFRLDEAFGELEALVASQRKKHNIAEPAFGPAMIAHFQGNPKHKDTKLIIGVDEDHDDEPLQVSIVSPWAKQPIEQRNFENNKEGYSDAMKYANLLRSAPLDKNDKGSHAPNGWED